jgi:DNA-binding transcriptional MerR regulator
MRAGLTIGDFSRITHLSVKTLRRYHEAGLLEPDEVDGQTGYRYYSTEQIPTAQVIRHFRELGMPVREVGEVLATTDPQARRTLISSHLDRLQNQLDQTRAAVTSLRRLLDPAGTRIEVEHRSAPALSVAAIRENVALADVLTWYGPAMTEIRRAVLGTEATGPAGGLYDNALFSDERGEVVVYLPVADPPTIGRVRPLLLPARELAVTVHQGPHDDIDVTYGSLGRYVTEHEIAVAGPVQEIYLVGPADTDEPSAWQTEIAWPIFRTSSTRA